MKHLLPVVNSEIGFSLAKSVGEQCDKAFIKKELKKIKKENPTVAEFIQKWASLGKYSHAAFCGVLVYNLLRSQAEADRMTEDFNLED
jgi:hypothetical protein